MVTTQDLKPLDIVRGHRPIHASLTAGIVGSSEQDSWWIVNIFIILLCLASVATIMFTMSDRIASAAAGMYGKQVFGLRSREAERVGTAEEGRGVEDSFAFADSGGVAG
ncbi:hypothetical protein B0A48_15362 [Cryoendolithus antarcticus]|uniref:Uncharacterized protein n=1 Tax=Cryoendolithus antarcticus TaxID=1507870 RepID=A0A1V8SHT1_9PEZI|nr:hypothetical protein B0A48_15362 [Cryoendolithus antarcticus]